MRELGTCAKTGSGRLGGVEVGCDSVDAALASVGSVVIGA
jgi:hypothetical protein